MTRTLFDASLLGFGRANLWTCYHRPKKRTGAFFSSSRFERDSPWPDLSNGARVSEKSKQRCTAPTLWPQSSPPSPLSILERGNEGVVRGGRMNAQLRRRLEMAARARDFLRAHQM